MSSSNFSSNKLAFSSQIKIILSVKKCYFNEIVEYIFQHILFMQFCKNNDNNVILIDLTNIIEFRFVISLVI